MAYNAFKQPPLGSQAVSAYGNCLGCGALIIRVSETTGELRTHCSVCAERQGKAPTPSMNVHPTPRPPYERRLQPTQGDIE